MEGTYKTNSRLPYDGHSRLEVLVDGTVLYTMFRTVLIAVCVTLYLLGVLESIIQYTIVMDI